MPAIVARAETASPITRAIQRKFEEAADSELPLVMLTPIVALLVPTATRPDSSQALKFAGNVIE